MKNFLVFTLILFNLSIFAVNYDVKMLNQNASGVMVFEPAVLKINVGDTVRWTWGSGTHNLRTTSGVESFSSDFHSTEGFQYTHQFNQVGATQYVCDPHPSTMFGTITVTD